MKQYAAYYAQDTEEKILYLTFDCGYENGATPAILDALKKHQVPAAFFVVGNFVRDNPDLIQRMTKEGHTVGNHTSVIRICLKFLLLKISKKNFPL